LLISSNYLFSFENTKKGQKLNAKQKPT